MKKESDEWAKIALEDFQSAGYLFDKSLYRMVCYHSQQAVEKILKAILTEHDIEIVRTHNILDLNNAVEKIGHKSPIVDEDTIFLNSVYRARYPFDLWLLPSGEPTIIDAEKALNIAQQIVCWFKNIKKNCIVN